jgi:hypothetical protein
LHNRLSTMGETPIAQAKMPVKYSLYALLKVVAFRCR